ncbi:MAG TPA: class I SAM-dependent methyltransferase [Streptosporangiaceae bacterium]|jgi:cyclopropane fatty-acyl-phospholipid synthase-like methyltransferase
MTIQPGWDSVYGADEPPPWDIGRPQPVLERLAGQGLLRGRLLDSGCGTGENTMMAAAHGADALGVDVAPTAIARAQRNAAERGSAARFQVSDVLDLGELGLTFDTVVDSGVFHVFDDGDRVRYVASLASVMRPGAVCYLMCFSDRQPGDAGPRRISQDELTAAFRDGWAIDSISAETFAIRFQGRTEAQAWLATIQRTGA